MHCGRLSACRCRHRWVNGPPKTERPQRLALREDPINHHVTDRPHGAVAD
jgi:hypothetical protein